jgi:voltage-gated potassium channel
MRTGVMYFLERIFTDVTYVGYRRFQNFIALFIFISCIGIALETLTDFTDAYGAYLSIFEKITLVVFIIEYIGNLYFAPNRLKFIFSFWGLVDLMSILPSLLLMLNSSALRGTKILRVMRVLRVLRVLKLARQALEMLAEQVGKKRNPLIVNLNIYLITLFAVVMISSSVMYYVEGVQYAPSTIAAGQAALDALAAETGATPEIYVPTDPITGSPIPDDKHFFESIPTSMWWCFVTLTTTGYGDLYPVTLLGRINAVVTMFAGLILFSILMNLVGRTVMILLFGQTLGGDEQEEKSTDSLSVSAQINPLTTALVLLERQNLVTADQAARIVMKPSDEIKAALTQLAGISG